MAERIRLTAEERLRFRAYMIQEAGNYKALAEASAKLPGGEVVGRLPKMNYAACARVAELLDVEEVTVGG